MQKKRKSGGALGHSQVVRFFSVLNFFAQFSQKSEKGGRINTKKLKIKKMQNILHFVYF